MPGATRSFERDIGAFLSDPRRDDRWLELDATLQRVFEQEDPRPAFPTLFRLLEAFPEQDGFGVLWTVVHGLEHYEGSYEMLLVDSVRRAPTELTLTMLNRLLNGGEKELEGVSYVDVLRSAAADARLPDAIRQLAGEYAEAHDAP